MKIIDLLNKIANGEEVPKKIKYKDWLYDWNEIEKDYECGNDWLEERICDDFKTFLNDEVEIISEEKEIEKIELIKNYQEYLESNFTVPMTNIFSDIETMFNELIDEINKLKRDKE